ncbi:MAG: glycosyltransferase family 2 protein [Betaproteobacteria bacterium]|nr:glycosyltransferase family 2 protein [Betaproteobacteria bacterium]
MTLPLVSIAIPAYRHAHFIEACLASVCAQTYPELEIVVLDDGSPDDTYEVARRFLEAHRDRFRRIVVERHENRGVSANSNACIAACQGEWVHLLGSDDLLYPEKVAHIQQAIADWQTPGLALVHADADFVNENGQPVQRSSLLPRPAVWPADRCLPLDFHGPSFDLQPDSRPASRVLPRHRRLRSEAGTGRHRLLAAPLGPPCDRPHTGSAGQLPQAPRQHAAAPGQDAGSPVLYLCQIRRSPSAANCR